MVHTHVEGKLAQFFLYVIVVFATNWSTVDGAVANPRCTLRDHMVYSGMTMQLKCNYCKNKRLGKHASVFWEYQATDEDDVKPLGDPITLRKGLKYSSDKQTLTLLRVMRQDRGSRYFCKLENTKELLSDHHLTVFEMIFTKFHTFFSSKTDEAYGEGIGYSEPVRSEWTAWSNCNRCGELGERFRIGICIIYIENGPNGTPCRSDLTRRALKAEYKDRLDEKEVAECERACPRGYQEVVPDKNYVAKLVDLHLGRPTLRPSVEKRTIYVPEKEDIELTCPGGGSTDAISWKNGSDIIHRSQLRSKHDHVFIDYMNVLHVRDATPHDAQEYECLYGDDHIATVKLIVGIPLLVNDERKGKLKYLGFVFTGLVVILIFLTINKNRKLHKRLG